MITDGETLRREMCMGVLARLKLHGLLPPETKRELEKANSLAVEYMQGYFKALRVIGGDDLANKVSGLLFLTACRDYHEAEAYLARKEVKL